MRYIITQESLIEFARALGIPADWHEVDEYGITAEVRGTPGDFDNAFPPAHEYTNAGHAELYVVLQKTEWCDRCKEHKTVEDLAAVNLAMLFAWASGYRDENLGRFKPSIPQPRESTENDDPAPPIDEPMPIDGLEEDQRVKEIRRLLVESRGRTALDILLDVQRVIFT